MSEGKKSETVDRSTGSWVFTERPFWVVVGVFVLVAVSFLWLGTFAPHRQIVVGIDPVGYYAWAHSILFDRDLDFHNEYSALNPPGLFPPEALVSPDGERTVTGRLGNPFSIGPGLLWSPFLIVAHAYAVLAGVETDGFARPYQTSVFYANALYGLAGLLLSYAALRRWFEQWVSAVGAVGAWACTPALYYTFCQYAMSHASSYFAVALLLFVWAREREREGYAPWILVGLALGLATLVRWQNLTFAVIPALDLLWRDRARNAPRLAACAAATVVMFIPQMIGWKIVYGSFVTVPQGGGFVQWFGPDFVGLFFSGAYGLVTWTPLTALCIAGLFLWKPEHRRVLAILCVALIVQVYVNAAAPDPGWSFGMRRMTNCMPVLAVGLAVAARRMSGRVRWSAALVAVFAVWNWLFVVQYAGLLNGYYITTAFVQLAEEQGVSPKQLQRMNRLPSGEPFSLNAFIQQHEFPRGTAPTLRQFTVDKLLVVQAVMARPFAAQ